MNFLASHGQLPQYFVGSFTANNLDVFFRCLKVNDPDVLSCVSREVVTIFCRASHDEFNCTVLPYLYTCYKKTIRVS